MPGSVKRQAVMRATKWVAIVVAVLAAAVFAAGCGGDDSTSAGTSTEATPTRVALVTDIGGLNDRGFNALANKGLQQAKRELGIDGRVFISKTW